MRNLAFFAPLAAVLAFSAAPAMAEPALISVSLGPDLQDKARELGPREVQEQADRLADLVGRALAREGALDGARIDLVLTDVRPNRPTFQQLVDRPGLDGHRSRSVGGAASPVGVMKCDQPGRRIRARRPPMSLRSRVMSPPWPRTTSRAMARPRPTPLLFWLREASRRENG